MRWAALALLGLLVIASGIAAFGAFESHVINVRARVIKPNIIEKVVLDDPLNEAGTSGITQEKVDQIVNQINDPLHLLPDVTGCTEASLVPDPLNPDPLVVPIETCVWWVLRITVTNMTGQDMHDVMVVDRFGAELGVGEFLDYVPVGVIPIYHTRGKPSTGLVEDGFFTQFRVVWCVTDGLTLPGPLDPITDDTCIGPDPPTPLEPGDSEFIDLLVFTKLNPAGKQEYTTPGTYTMNSGATLKWEQGAAGGPQASESTPSIIVTAVELINSLTINTDIDFGTVFPGETVSDYFELCLSDPGSSLTYDIDLELKPLDPPPGVFPDMRPYMVAERDPSETDTEADPIADGRAADYHAKGSLDGPADDQCDKWIVTLDVPHFESEYNAETDPQGGSHDVLPPEADPDPDGWDLGADVKIGVDGVVITP